MNLARVQPEIAGERAEATREKRGQRERILKRNRSRERVYSADARSIAPSFQTARNAEDTAPSICPERRSENIGNRILRSCRSFSFLSGMCFPTFLPSLLDKENTFPYFPNRSRLPTIVQRSSTERKCFDYVSIMFRLLDAFEE